jgi:hypothetical protein
MKALVLAGLATAMSFVLSTALFRLCHIERRAAALLAVFGLSLIMMIALCFATPDDLMIIPDNLLARPNWLDLASAVFFFFAAFLGGVLQLYNIADRGFSVRILIDLTEQPRGRATAATLLECYSRGKGIGWMYQKRIDDMIQNRLITVDFGTASLTERGARVAKIFGIMRRLLRVETK